MTTNGNEHSGPKRSPTPPPMRAATDPLAEVGVAKGSIVGGSYRI